MKLHLNRLCRIIVSLTMVFCLLFALCVPSHAVVGVDDAIIAGLIAALGSMGMDFFAQGLDRSGVVDEIVKWADDNIGQLPDRVELALVAPNVLSVGGVLWNYAVECAHWFKIKFPSGTGTDNLVVSSASDTWGDFFSGSGFYTGSNSAEFSFSAPSGVWWQFSIFNISSGNVDDPCVFFVSLSPFSILFYRNGSPYISVSNTSSVTVDGDTYYFGKSYFSVPSYISVRHDSTPSNYLSSFLSSSVPVTPAVGGSLDLVGSDVASPETVPDNKNMFLGLPSSFGSLPEFVDRVFDGVDSDSEAGPLQSDYSSQLSDLIDVNGGILSNTNTIAQGITGILSGFQALVADLVGFLGELPGYIGSLSGKFLSIWHYVVDWVNSLRPFLNSMLSVWSNLPYAMVLPVYATAVIVIVLGLYKRFFL